jgi:hypothetical protein
MINMRIKWAETTWYSKLLTIIYFVGILPAYAFLLGVQFEKTLHYIESARQSDLNALAVTSPRGKISSDQFAEAHAVAKAYIEEAFQTTFEVTYKNTIGPQVYFTALMSGSTGERYEIGLVQKNSLWQVQSLNKTTKQSQE